MCDERERLIGYVYDECDGSERRRVENHLESCATCREEISGLRDVRGDLLAWGVPEHDAVWRPFVAASPMPWWRQAPVWALAAAASVMFLAGAAGGAATHAWMPKTVVQAAGPVDPAPATRPQIVSVTPVDLHESERRILQLMRAELGAMNQRVRLASSHASPGRLVNAAADQEATYVAVYGDLARLHKAVSSRIDALEGKLRKVESEVAQQGGR